jgi:hypothetical protein
VSSILKATQFPTSDTGKPTRYYTGNSNKKWEKTRWPLQ